MKVKIQQSISVGTDDQHDFGYSIDGLSIHKGPQRRYYVTQYCAICTKRTKWSISIKTKEIAGCRSCRSRERWRRDNEYGQPSTKGIAHVRTNKKMASLWDIVQSSNW